MATQEIARREVLHIKTLGQSFALRALTRSRPTHKNNSRFGSNEILLSTYVVAAAGESVAGLALNHSHTPSIR